MTSKMSHDSNKKNTLQNILLRESNCNDGKESENMDEDVQAVNEIIKSQRQKSNALEQAKKVKQP